MEINSKEWNSGISVIGGEREELIMEKIGKRIIDMKGISEISKIKWVWSSVKKLVEDGKLERKKIGKKYYYRMKKVRGKRKREIVKV